jgi:acyl-CoA thioesterase
VIPKKRAEKSALAMMAGDHVARWMGMTLIEIDEGFAKVTLTVQQQHVNGHNICHGGITFTLADTAFAYACNSRNQSTVAMHNVITFLKPGSMGDTLVAEAREVNLDGRNGIYDVTVTKQDGTIIAQFRGISRAIRGSLFEENTSKEAP